MADEFNIADVTKAGLRSAATAAPALAPFVQLWNEHETVELKRRVDRFWEAFVKESQLTDRRLKAVEASLEYVMESVAVVQRALQHARAETSTAKQSLFAVIAVNAMASGPTTPHDVKLGCIDAANTLTATDLDVLERFPPNQPVKIASMPGTRSRDSLGMLIASLSKLESRGLIAETASPNVDTNTWHGDANAWENKWRFRYYELLPFGETFLDMCRTQDSS